MDAAVLAVVRASRPQLRTAHDKLAWAVHAYLLAEGFKLVATGAAAEDEASDFATSREEVGPEGWDSLEAAYAFRYQDTTDAGRLPLYVKCLAVGPQLLVHWVAGAGSSGGGGGGQEPHTLELDSAAFTTEAGAVPACYRDTPQLVAKLRQQLGGAVARGKLASSAAEASTVAGGLRGEGGGEASGSGRGKQQGGEPLRELPPPGMSGIGYRPPGVPVGIGAEDVVPPGVRPPGYGGGPVLPGYLGAGPHRGGGMHVGPGDPIFGPGRMGGGVGGPPGHGSLPPGARWDPVAPPGMPGFHPDDFQHPPGEQPRPPPPVHPDVMQPGAGGNSGWGDQMFG